MFWVSFIFVGGVGVANSARHPEAGPVYLRGAQRGSFHLNLRLKEDGKPVSAGEAGCGRELFLWFLIAVALLLLPCCRITYSPYPSPHNHHPSPAEWRIPLPQAQARSHTLLLNQLKLLGRVRNSKGGCVCYR